MGRGAEQRRLIHRGGFIIFFALGAFVIVVMFAVLLCWYSLEIEEEVKNQVRRYSAGAVADCTDALQHQSENLLLQLVEDRALLIGDDIRLFQRTAMVTAPQWTRNDAGSILDPALLSSEHQDYKISFSAVYDTYVSYASASYFAPAPALRPGAQLLSGRLSGSLDQWRRLQYGYEYLAWIIAITADGAGAVYPAVSGTGNDADLRLLPWFAQAQRQRTPYWSNGYDDPFGQGQVMTLALPFTMNQQQGVIGFTLALERLRETWFDFKAFTHVTSFCLDSQGKLLVLFGDDDSLLGIRVGETVSVEHPAYAEVWNRILTGEQGLSNTRWDEKGYTVVYAPLRVQGWSYGILLQEDEVISTRRHLEENLQKNGQEISGLFQHYGTGFRRFAIVLLLPVAFILFGIAIFIARSKNRKRSADRERRKDTPQSQ